MSPIQILLTIGVVFISVYMWFRVRHTLLDAVLIFLFMAVGIVFILFPETTNRLAQIVGVHKGANLLFYTGFLILFFLILKLYARSRRLEQTLTELVRKISLNNAREPEEE